MGDDWFLSWGDLSCFWETVEYGEEKSKKPFEERDKEMDGSDVSEKPKPAVKPDPKKIAEIKLKVTDVNLHIKENTQAHRTDKYGCTKNKTPELVCRRGQSIKMTIKLDHKFNKVQDDVTLIMEFGKSPKAGRGTRGFMPLDESGKKKFEADEWGATLEEDNGKELVVVMYIPCDCIVGEWGLVVQTKTKNDKSNKPLISKYLFKDDITILFNPWCEEDTVYMPLKSKSGKDLREEFVLNDKGAVYKGRWSKPWNFGQFKFGILDICLTIVRRAMENNLHKMNDPVTVSRAISRVVNSNDTVGVLTGRWDGKYSPYTSPGSWNGSIAILEQYMKTRRPVRYGQCWVFGGVTTTVCRALGIPCRPVTNVSSGHDSDCSNTLDKFFTMDGDEFEDSEHISDSVWNYHVWNEVWMKRPDILNSGNKYDGWQEIDATPQEQSRGFFQCGPAPQIAIKEGIVTVPYDTNFVYSEVNADRVNWVVLPDGTQRILKVFPDSVGKAVLTRDPEGFDFIPQNLTGDYKYKEGTAKERTAVMKAMRCGSKDARIGKIAAHQLDKSEDINVKLNVADAVVGEDVKVVLIAKNNGQVPRTINRAVISCKAVDYTDKTKSNMKRYKIPNTTIKPQEEFRHDITLTEDDYFLTEDSNVTDMIRIEARGFVEETSERPMEVFMEEEIFEFKKPKIALDVPKTAKVGSKVKVGVTVKNPLKRPLTGCEIWFESGGFKNGKVKVNDIPGNQTGSFNIEMEADEDGDAMVSFTFVNNECPDIDGCENVTVTPALAR